MDKSERNKFGTHGLFDVLLGLHGYKYEDWTYEVYVFRTKETRHTRDLMFMEEVMPWLHRRELLRHRSPGAPSLLRRSLGTLTPSVLARVESGQPENSSPTCVSPGWSDESFVQATSNMAQDPVSWLPINDSVASPIVKGDIIVTPNADTTVVAVGDDDILVQDNDTREKFHLSPLQSFSKMN